MDRGLAGLARVRCDTEYATRHALIQGGQGSYNWWKGAFLVAERVGCAPRPYLHVSNSPVDFGVDKQYPAENQLMTSVCVREEVHLRVRPTHVFLDLLHQQRVRGELLPVAAWRRKREQDD